MRLNHLVFSRCKLKAVCQHIHWTRGDNNNECLSPRLLSSHVDIYPHSFVPTRQFRKWMQRTVAISLFLFFRKKLIGQDSRGVIRFLLVLQPAPTKARAKSAMVSVIGLSKHVHRTAAFNANVSAFWNLISERGIFAVQPVQWQKCAADCSRRVKSSREIAREHQPDAAPRHVGILWSAYTRLHTRQSKIRSKGLPILSVNRYRRWN